MSAAYENDDFGKVNWEKHNKYEKSVKIGYGYAMFYSKLEKSEKSFENGKMMWDSLKEEDKKYYIDNGEEWWLADTLRRQEEHKKRVKEINEYNERVRQYNEGVRQRKLERQKAKEKKLEDFGKVNWDTIESELLMEKHLEEKQAIKAKLQEEKRLQEEHNKAVKRQEELKIKLKDQIARKKDREEQERQIREEQERQVEEDVRTGKAQWLVRDGQRKLFYGVPPYDYSQ